MRENERTDLRPLRAEPAARERVVGGAMARIRDEPTLGPVAVVLSASGRYLVPTLAAAALVGLLLLGSDGAPPPDGEIQGAGVILDAAGTAPEPWLRWSLTGERPDPGQVLVMFAGDP